MSGEAPRAAHAYAQVQPRAVSTDQRLWLAVMGELNVIRDRGSRGGPHPEISQADRGEANQGRGCERSPRTLGLSLFCRVRFDRIGSARRGSRRIRQRLQGESQIRGRLKPLLWIF